MPRAAVTSNPYSPVSERFLAVRTTQVKVCGMRSTSWIAGNRGSHGRENGSKQMNSKPLCPHGSFYKFGSQGLQFPIFMCSWLLENKSPKITRTGNIRVLAFIDLLLQ
eukprot:2310668-Amphidinium_carterae.2